MMQGLRLKNLFLRLLPYFISMVAGYVIYMLSLKYVNDTEFSGLLSNIAAGLLSIPLVFISYELVNDICTRDIKNSMLKNLIFEINYPVIEIIKTTQTMLGLPQEIDEDALYNLMRKTKKFIKANLQIKKQFADNFTQDKDKLFQLTHNNPNLGVLSDAQIKALMMINKYITIIAKAIEGKNANKLLIEENIYLLLGALNKWMDLVEEDAIINHHDYTLQ